MPPQAQRTWLEEEVVYIITEQEREVYLSLETLEEKERFIEAFWRRRDPNPATPANEFRDEHYRRLEYANKYLGVETFRQGWKTDRGRYYIMLGEPRQTERFDGYGEVVSIELWFYQSDPTLGLPPFFYLPFFKKYDVGEYQLYHPLADGPSALLRGQYHAGDDREAFEILRRISPDLAQASQTFDTNDPGNPFGERASLGTDILLARIDELPKRAVRTDYAEAYFRYGSLVSADYSFNYVPSRSFFAVLIGAENTPFVHFGIELEPQNFALETDEERTKYYTTLDVGLEVRDASGTLVLANDREYYLELPPSRIQQIRALPFAFQDMFPLVPGDYTVMVILRNRVTSQYTVAEREITTPQVVPDKPSLSRVVLGYDIERFPESRIENQRAFQVGGICLLPAAEETFAIGETVHVFAQIRGARSDHRLRVELASETEILQRVERTVSEFAEGPMDEPLSLLGMVGGSYLVNVELLDRMGQTLDERSARLQVTPRTMVPRPGFVYRRGFNAAVPGRLPLVRGEQLLALGRFVEARRELEEAVAANNPGLPMAQWKLASVLLSTGEPDSARKLLLPLQDQYPNQHEVIGGLGFAYYIEGDLRLAIGYLERAATLRPPDTSLLNTLGDAYERSGELDKARAAWERSLDLDSGQIEVKRRLAAMP